MMTILLILLAFVLGAIASHELQSRRRASLEREIAILRDRLSAGGRTRADKRREAYDRLRDQKTAQLRRETQR